MVPPASHRVSRVRRYSGSLPESSGFRVRGSYPVSPAFPCRSATPRFCDSLREVLQPRPGFRSGRFALGPRSLATTRGISVDFSSSGYLDVSVPRVASAGPMCSGRSGGEWPPPGSPIRRSAGQSSNAAHRGLSQLVASFVGFHCQGIHRAPLLSS